MKLERSLHVQCVDRNSALFQGSFDMAVLSGSMHWTSRVVISLESDRGLQDGAVRLLWFGNG